MPFTDHFRAMFLARLDKAIDQAFDGFDHDAMAITDSVFLSTVKACRGQCATLAPRIATRHATRCSPMRDVFDTNDIQDSYYDS